MTVLPAALELFESPYQDRVYYKVDDGKLLAGSPDLPVPPGDLRNPVFFDCTLDGLPIRAVAYARQLYNDGTDEAVTVVVAKTGGSQRAMFAQLWRPLLLCECLMLVLVAALVPVGLAVELRPLIKLKDDVAGLEPMQIEPMPVAGLPRELHPIVEAINPIVEAINQCSHNSSCIPKRSASSSRTPCIRSPRRSRCSQIQYTCRSIGKIKAMTSQLLLLALATARAG